MCSHSREAPAAVAASSLDRPRYSLHALSPHPARSAYVISVQADEWNCIPLTGHYVAIPVIYLRESTEG